MLIIEQFPSILILSTFLLLLLLIRKMLGSGLLGWLVICIPIVYLVPAFLLVSGFKLVDSFRDLRMDQAEPILLSLKASVLVFISTIACILGARMSRNFFNSEILICKDSRNFLPLIFASIGSISLHLYAMQIGGYVELFTTVLIYKSGVELTYTDYAFLKTLTVISSAAYFPFVDLAVRQKSSKLYWIAFLCFIVGAGGVYIQGGRVSMLIYLLPIIFAFPNKFRVALLGASPFAAIIIFDPQRTVFSAGDRNIESSNIISAIISDFFPGLGNLYWLQLDTFYTLRWFKDVLMVPYAFLPKRILDLGDYEGEASAIFNLVGFPNAADLIGFGIISASIVGVFVWSFIYGCVLSVISKVTKELLISGFKVTAASLVIYFVFRPMYFSPQHFLFTFLPYLYLLFFLKNNGRHNYVNN